MMNKQTLSGREKAIAVILVAVLGIAFIYRGLYIPFKDKSELVSDKILAGEKQLSKNLKIIRKSKQYEKEYQPLLENFRQKGSNGQTMSDIITEIESAGAQVNLRIADMKPQKVRQTGSFNHFSVSLILDGQLTSIMNFIYDLQNQPHLFSVDELRLDKKSPNSPDLKGYLILSRILIQP